MKCYLEHAAIPVRDIEWHIRFFRDILCMEIRQVEGTLPRPGQIWFWGGIQLRADPDFAGPEGRLAHLGIMTDDLQHTLAAVYAAGATELPQGRNWIRLPDGLEIEFIQAENDAAAKMLAINPWQSWEPKEE